MQKASVKKERARERAVKAKRILIQPKSCKQASAGHGVLGATYGTAMPELRY